MIESLTAETVGAEIPVILPLSEARRGETEAQFRELITHLQQVFWVKSANDTAVTYVSPAYERIWGRTCASLYDNSHTLLDSVHPEDHVRVAAAMARKHETEGYDEEYRIVRPDGSIRWIWARTYPVRDAEGVVQRYAGIAEDVSERKWAEKERSRLAAIIELTEDAIVSITLAGIIIAWNHGAERKYGYLAEEIIGRSIFLLIPADHSDAYLEVMKRVRKGDLVPAYDTVRRRKDGSLINFSVNISPIEARDGEIVGVSKVGNDISQVRKLEAQLIEAQKMDVIGQLTGGVVHDFNNILSIILGYSELTIGTLAAGDPLLGPMSAVRLAAERGSRLTRQLLVFSRKETVQPVVLDLTEVLRNIDGMLRRIVDERIALVVTSAAGLGRINADPGYLEQLLMNLVVNARDAMPEGGKLHIETSGITVSESRASAHPDVPNGAYILLRVSDTGTGMTDEVRRHLFEPFFTTKPSGKGTGLGLTTCRTIVQRSGGHIRVASVAGQGTTFSIYFPRVAQLREVAHPAQAEMPNPRGHETILVVEDDTAVRQLVCTVLETQGYAAVSAADGEAALQAFREHTGAPIRLVVSDVVMPLMDGNAMAHRLGTKHPELKFLFTSGYTNQVIAEEKRLQRGSAFLPKPFTVAALTRKVRELLDTAAPLSRSHSAESSESRAESEIKPGRTQS